MRALRRKRHGTSITPPTVVADRPDRVWAVDFQFDVTTNGWPIKIVSIIDEHTRECLGGMVERSVTGDHLVDELDRVAGQRGTYPTVLRCDNGRELALQCNGRLGPRAGRVALHPARRALVKRVRRIVQLPHPRRVPQHQQLLVAGAGARGNQRLETRPQPPPATQRWATNPRPAMLPPVPTDERLSLASSRGPVSRHSDAGVRPWARVHSIPGTPQRPGHR